MKHYPQNTNTVSSSFEEQQFFFQKEILVTCHQDMCNKPYLMKDCQDVITFTLLFPSSHYLQKSAFNPSKWKISFLYTLKLYQERTISLHRRQIPLSPPVSSIFFSKNTEDMRNSRETKEAHFLGVVTTSLSMTTQDHRTTK